MEHYTFENSLWGAYRRKSRRFFFFFNDTATTEIYTLSLHDALPISRSSTGGRSTTALRSCRPRRSSTKRSEEHTSELQSQSNLVCRLLLEKKTTSTIRRPRPLPLLRPTLLTRAGRALLRSRLPPILT